MHDHGVILEEENNGTPLPSELMSLAQVCEGSADVQLPGASKELHDQPIDDCETITPEVDNDETNLVVRMQCIPEDRVSEMASEVQHHSSVGKETHLVQLSVDSSKLFEEGSKDKAEPHIGMQFQSYEQVCEFYNQHARIIGFDTMIRRSWYDDNKKIKRFVMACCKEGEPSHKVASPYSRPSTKTNCQASITVKVDLEGLFHIVKVHLDHNHPVIPSNARFPRSNKKLPEKSKKQVEHNVQTKITTPHKSLDLVVAETGGSEKIQCGEKECRDHSKKMRLKLGEGDAKAIHQHFIQMQTRNSNFFYLMDLDNEGCLKNVFWADGRSRNAYNYFGDIVSFDTTYLTNKYDLPFASFVGVNHHGQSVLLGCGLLSSETTESYVWLFKAWLSCMSGRPPNAIITDECRDVKAAVTDVFPKAHHRYCLCHLMKKVTEKFNKSLEYKAVKKAMKKTVYDSSRVEEFEENWRNMIKAFGLEDNDWLRSLYEDRHMWVPILLEDVFWAGMSTTERSESMKSFFDGYVHLKTSLREFLSKYDMVINSKYEAEAAADFESTHKTPKLISNLYKEEQLSRIYSSNIFKMFQDEVKALINCSPSLVREDGLTSIYEVKERVRKKDGKRIDTKYYEVSYNANEENVQCICRSFQFKGILCRHSLCVLNHKDVDEIASRYILDRWRKDFKHCHSSTKDSNNLVLNGPMDRYDDIYGRCARFAEVGSLSKEKHELVIRLITEAVEKLKSEDIQPKSILSDHSRADTNTLANHTCGANQDSSSTHHIMNGIPINYYQRGEKDQIGMNGPNRMIWNGHLPEKRKQYFPEKIAKTRKKKGQDTSTSSQVDGYSYSTEEVDLGHTEHNLQHILQDQGKQQSFSISDQPGSNRAPDTVPHHLLGNQL